MKKLCVLFVSLTMLLTACVGQTTRPPEVEEPECEIEIVQPAADAQDTPDDEANYTEQEVEEQEPFSDPAPETQVTAAETAAPVQPQLSWDDLLFESIDPATVVDNGMLTDRGGSDITRMAPLWHLSFDTLNNPEAVEAFAQAIRDGRRMADMLIPMDFYFATNGYSTVQMHREGNYFVVGLVILDDPNPGHDFTITDAVRAQLSEAGIAPTANTTVRYVVVVGFGTGLLFSQGSTEYIAFTTSVYDGQFGEQAYLPSQTLMTTLELAEIMESLRHRVVGGVLNLD